PISMSGVSMRHSLRPCVITGVLVAATLSAACAGDATAPSNAGAAHAAKPAGQGDAGQGIVMGNVVVASDSGPDTAFTPVPGATVSAYLYVFGTDSSGGGGP